MLMQWLKLTALLSCLASFAGCSAVKIVDALTPSDTYLVTPDVAYGELTRQKLDVYEPKGAAPAGGFPVVVFFYGGGWHTGERAGYRFMGEALASRGMVTMVADYRLYPDVTYPDFLPDCAMAVAYALRHADRYRGNPHRVVVMGHSAGAYNAAMMALDGRWLKQQGHLPDELAGWVGLAGPYDFTPISDEDARETFHHPNVPMASQPIRHVSSMGPRAFIGAAKDDGTVDPQRNSVQLASRLQAEGVPVELKVYDHVGHVSLIAAFASPLRGWAPVLNDVTAFVQGLPAAGERH